MWSYTFLYPRLALLLGARDRVRFVFLILDSKGVQVHEKPFTEVDAAFRSARAQKQRVTVVKVVEEGTHVLLGYAGPSARDPEARDRRAPNFAVHRRHRKRDTTE